VLDSTAYFQPDTHTRNVCSLEWHCHVLPATGKICTHFVCKTVENPLTSHSSH